MDRVCNKCNILKDLSEYYFNRVKNNYQYSCKDCQKKRIREWQENNKDRERERKKEYMSNLPAEKKKEYMLNYKEKNKEKVTESQRKNYLKKKDVYIEKYKEKVKKYRSSEHYKKINAVHKQNRRKNLENKDNNLTVKQWDKILCEFNKKCPLSKKEDISLDHFIPISKGGSNEYKNVIPIQKNLNYSKNNRNPFTWAESKIEQGVFTRERWNKLVEHLAKKNKMSVEVYKKYVESFF